MSTTAIEFAPLFPWTVLAVLAGLAVLALLPGFLVQARGTGFRLLAASALLLALANPSLVEEEREPLKDVAALVVDDTPSQSVGMRRAQLDEALATIRERLAVHDDTLEVRVLTLRHESVAAADEGTRMVDPLIRLLADVPPRRIAGTIVLTDGQIHDLPEDPASGGLPGPVHVLLTGAPDERDRRLVVTRSPSYGIVDDTVSVTVRVDDQGGPAGGSALVELRHPDGRVEGFEVRIGQNTEIPVTLEHAGPTILELSVDGGPSELTLANNRAVIEINGVRDRLRVLLVSGEPHAGERTWRNLLKSDPSVDLVHFTILRPPEKQDGTPINELSLISFPTRELFEVKLHEFDLVIFDRYRRRGVLPPVYLQNIVDYVMGGGALLEAVGPTFASPYSIYRTPLGAALPGEPTGAIIERGFRPVVTETGHRHPVTADLPGHGGGGEEPKWGRWFRLMDVDARRGHVLMTGAEDRPLVILDRIGLGRVAQINSDHIWLWARGYEGGGPQAELLRRMAHWLMQEPDLEEESIVATVEDDKLKIVRRSVEPDDWPIELLQPDGETVSVELTETKPGRYEATVPVTAAGLYRVSDGINVAMAAVGALNPLEFADVRANAAVAAPVATATGGSVNWLSDGLPSIRRVKADRSHVGRGWIGLVANGDYLVTGVRQVPAYPGLLALMLALGAMVFAWRREGQ
ncbi:MAG: hypothetical protein JSU82_16130 [Rhodospirillales bacterium]|nr:MAG: hypothetical protein JSU82_16130 [Rhodospirillales bacterium]